MAVGRNPKFMPERCVTSRLNLRFIERDRGATAGCYISFQMAKPASSGTVCTGTLTNGPNNRRRCVPTPLSARFLGPGTSVRHANTSIWLRLQAAHMQMRYAYWISFLILHKGTNLIFMILSFEVCYRQIRIIIIPGRKVLFLKMALFQILFFLVGEYARLKLNSLLKD